MPRKARIYIRREKRMHRRIILLTGLFVLAAIGLCWRLQALVGDGSTAVAGGQSRGERSMQWMALRGTFYDRNMQPLTGSDEVYITAIEPQYFLEEKERAELRLCLGGMSIAEEKWEQRAPFFVMSRKEVHLPGVTQWAVPDRYGALMPALHTLGYCDTQQTTGLSGLEQRFDELLKNQGMMGVRYRSDASGHTMGTDAVELWQEQQPGKGVQLTLDCEIQQVVTEVVRSHMDKGCVVVMGVQSGNLLAVESQPVADPYRVSEVLDGTEGELVNRAFQPYPVGSVFKLVTAAAALEEGICTEDMTYCCTGSIDVGGVGISCSHHAGHGTVDMQQAFAQSCNPYFIHLAQMVGAERMVQYAKALGFGQETLLNGVMALSAGNLPTVEQLSAPAALANLSIGQGELLATPVQVCNMLCAIARGGSWQQPGLLVGQVDSQGNCIKRYQRAMQTVVLSPDTCEKLLDMMRLVVTEGTGAAAEVAGAQVCGKTSSAQGGGSRVDAWFAGVFPRENPKYAIVVLCEDGREGGKTAAPIFGEIASRMWKMEQ